MYNSSKRGSIDDNDEINCRNGSKRFKQEEESSEQAEIDSDTDSCYEFNKNLNKIKDEFNDMKAQIKHLKQKLETYQIMNHRINETNYALLLENVGLKHDYLEKIETLEEEIERLKKQQIPIKDNDDKVVEINNQNNLEIDELKRYYLERIKTLEEENENLKKKPISNCNHDKIEEIDDNINKEKQIDSEISVILPENLFNRIFYESEENLVSLSSQFNLKIEFMQPEYYNLITKDKRICKLKGYYENILAFILYFIQESENLSDSNTSSPINKSNKSKIQLLVTKNEAAYIIGKKGCKIDEIRNRYQVFIDFKGNMIDYRICKIKGMIALLKIT